jgi:transposase
MMGRLNHDQQQLFYSFRLDEAVPDDHPVRNIAAVLDLSWVHSELAQFYPKMGRPSIDPELMIRMLIIGYVFAIRSERAICRDLQVNLAHRWFCRASRTANSLSLAGRNRELDRIKSVDSSNQVVARQNRTHASGCTRIN